MRIVEVFTQDGKLKLGSFPDCWFYVLEQQNAPVSLIFIFEVGIAYSQRNCNATHGNYIASFCGDVLVRNILQEESHENS